MRSSKQLLDRSLQQEDPPRMAVVTDVHPKTEGGNHDLYTVNVAVLESGSQPIDFTEKTVEVSGGELMQMSKGSASGPPGWNTDSGTSSPTSSPSNSDNPLVGEDVNSQPEQINGPYSTSVRDGQSLGNKRIDATSGTVQIVGNGKGWVIKNISVVGANPEKTPVITAKVSQGGFGLIENVYIDQQNAGSNPIFVHLEHAGTLTIRNVNLKNNGNEHGVYGAAPGSPPWRKQGSNGVVQIEDSFSANHNFNGYRIGTPGSYVKNCVAKNCGSSGVWNQWQTGRVEDCRLQANVNGFNVGANDYDNRDNCKLTAVNTEWDAPNKVRKAPGIQNDNYFEETNVTNNPNLDLTPPSGVPLTPEEAAGI